VLKASLRCERTSVHVEYFSLLSVNREEDCQQRYFGPGGHFLVTPNLEIGARVFWGLSEGSAEFLRNAGLGVRF
jgi:hypothetical protein